MISFKTAQWLGFDNSQDNLIPEKNLLLAMLERAGLDANGINLKSNPDRGAIIITARQWLSHRSTAPHAPFTFNWVCEMLDLNPGKLRAQLLNLPKNTIKSRLPWESFKYFVL